MKRYIIEIDADKIFTYEATGGGDNFACRLLKPHGDKFHSTENHWDYWDWFAEETAAVELDACFLCPEDERQTLERLRNAAQDFTHAEQSSWRRSELKKFFATYRDAPTAKNFSWDACRLTFDDGKIFLLANLSTFVLTDDAPPAAKVSPPPKTKAKVRVWQPAAQSKPLEKISAPEQKIPQTPSAEPAEAREKISAADLQNFIAAQTHGQCAGESRKS